MLFLKWSYPLGRSAACKRLFAKDLLETKNCLTGTDLYMLWGSQLILIVVSKQIKILTRQMADGKKKRKEEEETKKLEEAEGKKHYR